MGAPKGNNFAKGNKGGRPTKYTPEILEKANEYLSTCNDTKDENGKLVVSLPMIAGLARHLKVSRETLYQWGKENKEFSDILTDIHDEQEKRLIGNALNGTYNAVISKLILSAKHEYREQSDITTKGNELNTLNVHFINAKDGNN